VVSVKSLRSCSYCHAQIEDGSNSCHFCGAPVEDERADKINEDFKISEKELVGLYEESFALAQEMAKRFLAGETIKRNGKTGTNAVIDYYITASIRGGEKLIEYWLSLAEFHANQSIYYLKINKYVLLSKARIVEIVESFMESAERAGIDEDDLQLMRQKMDGIIQRLLKELEPFPEQDPDGEWPFKEVSWFKRLFGKKREW